MVLDFIIQNILLPLAAKISIHLEKCMRINNQILYVLFVPFSQNIHIQRGLASHHILFHLGFSQSLNSFGIIFLVFISNVRVLDLRCLRELMLMGSCMNACPHNCMCVFTNVWLWRPCRRRHWLLKVALLHQARPFNQVPHAGQLCPHCKAATLTHWRAASSSWGWQTPVSTERSAQAAATQTEFAFVFLFASQTEIGRLQRRQGLAAETVIRKKIYPYTQAHLNLSSVCVCVWLWSWFCSWQKEDNRSLENCDRVANNL